MPSQDKLQQLNLANFYGSVFASANAGLLEAIKSAIPSDIDYSICILFETYWWLNLGVELDYFPEQQARIILARHFVNRQTYHEFLARNPKLFPAGLITSLETALIGQRFFEPVDNYFFYS